MSVHIEDESREREKRERDQSEIGVRDPDIGKVHRLRCSLTPDKGPATPVINTTLQLSPFRGLRLRQPAGPRGGI